MWVFQILLWIDIIDLLYSNIPLPNRMLTILREAPILREDLLALEKHWVLLSSKGLSMWFKY